MATTAVDTAQANAAAASDKALIAQANLMTLSLQTNTAMAYLQAALALGGKIAGR